MSEWDAIVERVTRSELWNELSDLETDLEKNYQAMDDLHRERQILLQRISEKREEINLLETQ